MEVGSRVKIVPKETHLAIEWMKEAELFGRVLAPIEEDGTVAIEVEGVKMGHNCSFSKYNIKTNNGWWFLPNELEEI